MSFDDLLPTTDLVALSDQIKGYIDILAAPPYGPVINWGIGVFMALTIVFVLYELNSTKG